MRHGYIILIQAGILALITFIAVACMYVGEWIPATLCLSLLFLFFASSLFSSGFWTGVLYDLCADDLLPGQHYTVRSRDQKGDKRFIIVDTIDKHGIVRKNWVCKAPVLNWDTLTENKSYECWKTDTVFLLDEKK